ncbi:MAG: hypothetical protein JW786_08530 [Desulfobacterales bacterium]|nr:hypothetical protein [Desulfobacterales bacterium]
MRNILLEDIEYKTEETPNGTWRRFVWENGRRFEEYRSKRTIWGMPLLHYTFGICPETGRRVTAKGFIAIGRKAAGVIAIGHASVGLIAIGQLAIGILFGLGQASTGLAAIGQLAIGILFGFGQLVSGFIAIGQLGIGKYVLAQMGWGEHLWTTRVKDKEVLELLRSLLSKFW